MRMAELWPNVVAAWQSKLREILRRAAQITPPPSHVRLSRLSWHHNDQRALAEIARSVCIAMAIERHSRWCPKGSCMDGKREKP